MPEDLDCVDVNVADVEVDPAGKQHGAVVIVSRETLNLGNRRIVRLDKLIRHAGLAASNNEAVTKLKGGAVSIDGEAIGESNFIADMPVGRYVVLRVGRRIKKVRLTNPSEGKRQ
jgi:tyrosyl-tRNA synthetase